MSPPAPALIVTDAVLEAAVQAACARTAPYRTVVRARIICNGIQGLSNEENARRNGVHPDTVRKTRRRAAIASSAAEAFADGPRSGRPPRIALETRATLVQIACARPTPELARERIAARTKEAKRAKRAAVKARKRAEQQERRARRKARVGEAKARAEQRIAARAVKRAKKSAAAADVAIAAARADAARAAKGRPASFSAIWTRQTLQNELQRQTGITLSLSEIGRTLWCGGLRPHRVRIWLHSPDPDFHMKARAICDLYLNPPPDAVVLSVDEKTGMQARSDGSPAHVSSRGETRREFEYVRHGTQTLIAAFDIRTGEVFARCWRRTSDGVVRFLEAIARKHPRGEVYIVWDNLNVHSGPEIEAFNARQDGRFHFVYTPLHASWMNQIEIWFSILQRRVLRHGSFTSRADLEAAVMGFIRHWNDVERRPFRWRFRGEFAPRVPWAA